MHMQDRLTIDTKRRTSDGYMTVSARVARAGNVQLYAGQEVGKPELGTVRIYRPADEVFSRDTMQSFAHRPVTLGHPSSGVSSTNWRDVAKGWSDSEVVRDGDFVRVSMLLADATTIQAVENGTRELSMGYDCTLEWTSGVSPAGETYDAVQRGIRSNHIAVVPTARGGSELRLGDSAGDTRKDSRMMTDSEKRSMRDSVKGMPVDRASALPIYDNVRGVSTAGMPAERYYAILDGATVGQTLADGKERAKGFKDHSNQERSNAWKGGQRDSSAPSLVHARDCRRLDDMPAHERAKEITIIERSNAWKSK